MITSERKKPMKMIKSIFVLALFFIGFVVLAKTLGALLWGVVKVVFFVLGGVWLLKLLLGKDEDKKEPFPWRNR